MYKLIGFVRNSDGVVEEILNKCTTHPVQAQGFPVMIPCYDFADIARHTGLSTHEHSVNRRIERNYGEIFRAEDGMVIVTPSYAERILGHWILEHNRQWLKKQPPINPLKEEGGAL